METTIICRDILLEHGPEVEYEDLTRHEQASIRAAVLADDATLSVDVFASMHEMTLRDFLGTLASHQTKADAYNAVDTFPFIAEIWAATNNRYTNQAAEAALDWHRKDYAKFVAQRNEDREANEDLPYLLKRQAS